MHRLPAWLLLTPSTHPKRTHNHLLHPTLTPKSQIGQTPQNGGKINSHGEAKTAKISNIFTLTWPSKVKTWPGKVNYTLMNSSYPKDLFSVCFEALACSWAKRHGYLCVKRQIFTKYTIFDVIELPLNINFSTKNLHNIFSWGRTVWHPVPVEFQKKLKISATLI